MRPWTRLIRFLGKDGRIYNGEPQAPLAWPKASANLKPSAGEQDTLTAKVIKGDIFSKSATTVTDTVVPVAKLLSPLSHVPIFRCIGLNYAKHAAETKMPVPSYPVLFTKPSMALQDPFKPVVVPTICENNQADFECELAVVIGKPCKNVGETEALEYVLGYTVANDISARKWQGSNLGSSQWSFSKSFDTFAPLGPALVSTELIKDPNQLRIKTTLNGKVMQDSSTSDMIFNVPRIISFLSQSTTLMPGDVILTGTPEGVGFKRNPPVYLQHGDHVVCEIENIGELHNTVAYESKFLPGDS
ncbi:hypothetical protein BGZ65_003618 [Modicella reniformis]|uniref:Fumarylacetoacetase-like C-terminal domain-containing protein n=1 Tax=Modicella reniformis TaxID=1440133 RepID=A0A9P6INP9_9FUNG|nr:hypothetical protein BGZ65_003618 [Modicella reniformis]